MKTKIKSGAKKNFKEIGTRMMSPKKETDTFSKEDLKRAKPEIYAESIQDGVMLERGRIEKLTEMKKQPEYRQLPKVLEAIDKAIF
ncbi:hypothetical protein ES705_10000 [subsurface metagenome]